MRVLHNTASTTRSAGGLYFSVSGLAKAQAKLGISVFVAGGADKHYECDKYQWDPVSVEPVFTRTKYGLGLGAFRAIQKYNPAVMHVHGVWNAASLVGLYAAALGVVVVVSPRGMLDQWILARNRYRKQVHGLLIERPLLRKSYIHALNDAERTGIEKYLPSTKNRTFVVPNGVDPVTCDSLHTSRSGAVYLGRLHEKKQVLNLMEHWPKVSSCTGLRLTVAGWGDDAYERRVRDFAERTDCISFVGPAYGKAKADLLFAAKYFILPSLSEGFPMAVLEALAHGCLPLVTPECNVGVLTSRRVAVEISSDLSNLCCLVIDLESESEETSRRRSEQASDVVRQYTWESVADQMVHHYDSFCRAAAH